MNRRAQISRAMPQRERISQPDLTSYDDAEAICQLGVYHQDSAAALLFSTLMLSAALAGSPGGCHLCCAWQ